jgi:signal transduction histidine kinase
VGDPVLLAQALANMVDNALKYAPVRGAIAISAQRIDADTVQIVVADNGPGIPVHERTRVIERFYRVDASRGTPGVGLGLSVVSAVARLHGGTLTLDDNHPGLRATLRIGAMTPVASGSGSASARASAQISASAP